MDDVATRLREWRQGVRGQAITPTDALMEEAAGEIEHLRDEIERLREEIERLCGSGEIAQKPSEYRKDKERDR